MDNDKLKRRWACSHCTSINGLSRSNCYLCGTVRPGEPMTDEQFDQLLKETTEAYAKFNVLAEKAEAEYTRRYGENPREDYDGHWAEGITSGQPYTVKDVAKEAKKRGLSRI